MLWMRQKLSSESEEALAADEKWIIGDTPIERDPTIKTNLIEKLGLIAPAAVLVVVLVHSALLSF